MVILHDGMIILSAPIKVTTFCKPTPALQSGGFQNCTVKFGSWTYDSKQLDITDEDLLGVSPVYLKFYENDRVKLKRDLIYS